MLKKANWDMLLIVFLIMDIYGTMVHCHRYFNKIIINRFCYQCEELKHKRIYIYNIISKKWYISSFMISNIYRMMSSISLVLIHWRKWMIAWIKRAHTFFYTYIFCWSVWTQSYQSLCKLSVQGYYYLYYFIYCKVINFFLYFIYIPLINIFFCI